MHTGAIVIVQIRPVQNNQSAKTKPAQRKPFFSEIEAVLPNDTNLHQTQNIVQALYSNGPGYLRSTYLVHTTLVNSLQVASTYICT